MAELIKLMASDFYASKNKVAWLREHYEVFHNIAMVVNHGRDYRS